MEAQWNRENAPVLDLCSSEDDSDGFPEPIAAPFIPPVPEVHHDEAVRPLEAGRPLSSLVTDIITAVQATGWAGNGGSRYCATTRQYHWSAISDVPQGGPLFTCFGVSLVDRHDLDFVDASSEAQTIVVLERDDGSFSQAPAGSNNHRDWISSAIQLLHTTCPDLVRGLHSHMQTVGSSYSAHGPQSEHLVVKRKKLFDGRPPTLWCRSPFVVPHALRGLDSLKAWLRFLPTVLPKKHAGWTYASVRNGMVREVFTNAEAYIAFCLEERMAPTPIGKARSTAVNAIIQKLQAASCDRDGAVLGVAGSDLVLHTEGGGGDCLPAAISAAVQYIHSLSVGSAQTFYEYVVDGEPYQAASREYPRLANAVLGSVTWVRMLNASQLTLSRFTELQSSVAHLGYVCGTLEETRDAMLDPSRYWGCEAMLESVRVLVGLQCLVARNGFSPEDDSFYSGLEKSGSVRLGVGPKTLTPMPPVERLLLRSAGDDARTSSISSPCIAVCFLHLSEVCYHFVWHLTFPLA